MKRNLPNRLSLNQSRLYQKKMPEPPLTPTDPVARPSGIISTSPNVLSTIVEENEGREREGIVTDLTEPPSVRESLPPVRETLNQKTRNLL